MKQIPLSPWHVVVIDEAGFGFIRMFVVSLMFSAAFWYGALRFIRAIWRAL